MIDSHAHLDHCSRDDADLIADAERAGVRRVLAIGMDGASCRAALAAAEAFPQVCAAIGRHPNSATGFDDADLAELEALAAHERCVAIGETGLDHYRDHTPREDQVRAFVAQMDLARRAGKPVVIHTRAAEDDTLAMLAEHAAGLRVVMHCFSMPDRLDECLDRGLLDLLRRQRDLPEVRRAARRGREGARGPPPRRDRRPLSRGPAGAGQENEPGHVVHTARTLAEARGVEYEELEAAIERNAAEVFGW